MANSPLVAVIDVGTNSIKLLVARRGPTPRSVESVFEKTIETRIGGGIARENPALEPEAMERGCETIRELVRLARQSNPSAVRLVTTSAVRDAANGAEFVRRVAEATGFSLEILDGPAEAAAIGRGLLCDPAVDLSTDHFLQVDIGGGSLELIRFHRDTVAEVRSLPLGAVRLTEMFVDDREAPLSEASEHAIRTHVTSTLRESGFSFEPPTLPLFITGGAAAILRRILDLRSGDSAEPHPPRLHKEEIDNLKAELAVLPLEERKAVPGLPAARADIVPTALATVSALMEFSGRTEITHSFHNLRFGVADQLLN